MMRINGTLAVGRPISGPRVVMNTRISIQELINKASTVENAKLEDFQVTINTIPIPFSVRKEINLIIAKRVLDGATMKLGDIAVFK